jgi:hypothetical protein
MQALSALPGLVAAISIPWIGMGAIPTAWQARDSGTSNRLNGVAYGDGMYVAVGQNGTVVTSSDGTNWVHRSLGETNAELLCVTHGGGRFVAGGREGVLRSSTDGTNWTNGTTPPGVEQIYGVTYGYGLFVAVGQVEHDGTNYILTSSNGLDWVARDVATTNTLFAVTPAFNHQGGWESGMYAAVGDNGTIVTSGPDGIEWTTNLSGTYGDLRVATFHGGLIAGGSIPILRKTSASGPWERRGGAVPFTIRALASSGEALVAAGEGPTWAPGGRLTWSTDIEHWPEDSSVFPQPLHAICLGGGRFVAVGDQGWIMTSEGSVDNLWTKPTSGSWEESFWSLGRLPGQEQTVRLSNDGVKELAINAATTANYLESLSVQNLIVEGSNNLLRLDWAGKAVPLRIASDVRIGSGAALHSHSSAIEAPGLTLSGRVMLDDESMASFDSAKIGAYGPGELIISNATLVVSNRMEIGDTVPGMVTQYGGTNRVGGIMVVYSQGIYHLKGGTLELSWVEAIGYDPDPEFVVSGGTMRAGHIGLQGDFLMEGGTIESDTVGYHVTETFRQTGGHTIIRRGISIPDSDSYGTYSLDGGTLTSSNVIVGRTRGHGTFEQTSGVHTNGNLVVSGYDHRAGDYKLSGGVLISDRVEVEGGTFYHLGGTNLAQQVQMTDNGGYILSNGVLRASNVVVTNIPDPYRSRRGFVEVHGGEAHIENELRIESPSNFRLVSGALSVSNIFVSGNLMAWVPLTHSGTITLDRGALWLGTNQTYELGPLILGEGGSINLPQAGTAVVRFADSRNATWDLDGTLVVTNWSGSTNGGGVHRVFIGSNGQGLSASQLRQVWFRNPAGFPEGDHPARILASGEIVPVERTAIAAATTASGLRLSWSGSYELFTATNVAGPYVRVSGATSPYTNSFDERQRFFQLRFTAP